MPKKTQPSKPPADRIIKSGIVSSPKAPAAAPHLTGKIIFFPGWCKKCGMCSVICPREALRPGPDGTPVLTSPDRCTLCSLCWRICPDFAIIKNPNYREEEDGSAKNNA